MWGGVSASEAKKGLSGTMLKRNEVVLENLRAVAEWVIVNGKKVVY